MESVYIGCRQFLKPRTGRRCLRLAVAITKPLAAGNVFQKRTNPWWENNCVGKKTKNTLSSGGTLVKITGLILLNSECCHYLLVLKRISYLWSGGERSETVLWEYLSVSLTIHKQTAHPHAMLAHHTPTQAKYYSLVCIKRLHAGCAVMWLQFATKTVCDFPVTLAGGVSCTLRLTHTNANTHIQGTQTHACTNTCAQTHIRTKEPSRLWEPCPDLGFPVKRVLFTSVQQHHWSPVFLL